MSDKIVISLDMTLSRRALVWGFTALYLVTAVGDLASENVTLTTYYPAPSGIYTQLVTTGQTILARDGGNVGIGTAAPAYKLDVNGVARVSSDEYVMGKLGVGTTAPANKVQVVGSGGGTVDLAVNGRMQTGDAGGNGGVWLSGSNNMFVGQNGTNVGFWTAGFGWNGLQVAQNGNVGVGTTNPTASLHVSGAGGGRGYLYIDNSNTGCWQQSYTGDGGGGLGVCAAGQYATWQPGLYIEGSQYFNHGSQVYNSGTGGNPSVTYLYQDTAANTTVFAVDLGPGVVWCCPK